MNKKSYPQEYVNYLDKSLKAWKSIATKWPRPLAGWIKPIRSALCMTKKQFSERMGVHLSRVSKIEKAEIDDSITVKSMRRAAEALNCEFVYAIVPRSTLTLKELIKIQEKRNGK
jgi:predicted DNA-binding mobile mystery protein A